MYLFDLDMTNIKSEAPAQEWSKRKIFLKILQNSLENNCVRESLIMKVQVSWINSNFYVQILPGTGAFQ